jgi:paraquat-inducible protein B
VKVGLVDEHRLSPDGTRVLVTIVIFEPYHQLVRAQTRFWNSGGISVKIGLTGAELRSNSLESLLAGGVSFATPDDAARGQPPPDGTIFDLHDEHEKAWLKWQPRIPLEPTGS